MFARHRPSSHVFWCVLSAGACLILLGAALWHDFPVPANDSVEYLAYARRLHLNGVYAASEIGAAADSSTGREPLYPFLIAALAKLDLAWSQGLTHCSPPASTCASGLSFLKYVNALLLAVAAITAGVIARTLGGSRTAAAVATAYVALNFLMWRDLKYVMSDYLAVLLTALAVLLLAHGLQRWRAVGSWIVLAVTLALLALTKQAFLPFAILLAVGLLIYGVAMKRRPGLRRLVPGLVVLTVIGAINGAWALRNISHFGTWSDGRGSIALSTREVFDHMTPAEHAVAFLWFMRHPGPGWARSLFPEKDWHQFQWYVPDGFYLRGQVANHNARVERLKTELGVSEAVAQSRAAGLVVREILASWTGYLASMPAIFYRGLWFDAFMPLSLPLFVLPFLWAWREGQWLVLIALSPALWSLAIYPAMSLNIPRYQFTAVIALAIACGLATDRTIAARRAAN